ncbi:MAG: restriction endonuclease subunit S, partial [Magnetococcales bacterium]|nr:restriction endonuclease subunit S [Magnetococcales bacterium]MBF0116486.1 restriction endonuclease subunit S [Magnetococcales bacterium]
MSFPRYPEYKDSGVEWLGKVPRHWQVKRLKNLFEIKKRIAGEEGYDVLSITQQGIRVKDTDSNDGQLSMDYSKYQFVDVGDFAMNHMDLLTGYVDISVFSGVTSPDYRVFSIKNINENNSNYLLYLLQNGYRRKIFYAFGQGASQLGRWRLCAGSAKIGQTAFENKLLSVSSWRSP